MVIRIKREDVEPKEAGFEVSWCGDIETQQTSLEQFKAEARAVAESLYAHLIDAWCFERHRQDDRRFV